MKMSQNSPNESIGGVEIPSAFPSTSRDSILRSRSTTMNPMVGHSGEAVDVAEQTPARFDIFELESQTRLYQLHSIGPWYRVALLTLVLINVIIATLYSSHLTTEINSRVAFRKHHCRCVQLSNTTHVDLNAKCRDVTMEYFKEKGSWFKCDLETCTKEAPWKGTPLRTFYTWLYKEGGGADIFTSIANFLSYYIIYNYVTLYGGSEHLVDVRRGQDGEAIVVSMPTIDFRLLNGRGVRVTVPLLSFVFCLLIVVLSMLPLFFSFPYMNMGAFQHLGMRGSEKCKATDEGLTELSYLGLTLYATSIWWFLAACNAFHHSRVHPSKDEYRRHLFKIYREVAGGSHFHELSRAAGMVLASLFIVVYEVAFALVGLFFFYALLLPQLLLKLWQCAAPKQCPRCLGSDAALRARFEKGHFAWSFHDGTCLRGHNALEKLLYSNIIDRVVVKKKVSWFDISEVVQSTTQTMMVYYSCISALNWIIFTATMSKRDGGMVALYVYALWAAIWGIYTWASISRLYSALSKSTANAGTTAGISEKEKGGASGKNGNGSNGGDGNP